MKVTVERSELLRSLSHVHRVVERRNTIPILANVLIRAESGQLAFKATDLDLEVLESIAAEVGSGGVTTVPAHMFYDIVRKLPEGAQIILEGSGDRAVLLIRAGIVSAAALADKRPHVIVLCFAIGMVLTPPDVFSQTMLAVPMWLLFEAGLLCGRLLTPPAEPVKTEVTTQPPH